jgi:hypothetical protein
MGSIYNDFKPNQTNQMSNFISQFNQFRSAFTGNPEQRVKQLLQTGQMTQEQFNQFAETANQLRSLLK